MAASPQVGLQFLMRVIHDADTFGFIGAKVSPEYFTSGVESELFKFCSEHLSEHGGLPHPDTVKDLGFPVITAPEPYSYYLEGVNKRYTYKTFGMLVEELPKTLLDRDLSKAKTLVQEHLDRVYSSDSRLKLSEFKTDGLSIVKQHLISKWSPQEFPLLMGWPHLDAMSGGLIPGDVVSIVGRPGAGKTYTLLHAALNMWHRQAKNVVVVSMEMPRAALVLRLAAMYTKISISHIKHATLDQYQKTKLLGMQTPLDEEPANLWILDGNLTSTVDEVFALVTQLGADVVMIDGAYLLAHPDPRLNRFMRVAENTELIKKRTARCGIPTICTYQFNREAAKKQDKKKRPGLEDIAYSDVIGQISSLVLGMFDEEDDASTIAARTIDILKGREGETGCFKISWRFDLMQFAQLEHQEAESDPVKEVDDF